MILLPGLVLQAVGQVTDFGDGKQLQTAPLAELLRIDALVDDQRWEAAGRAARQFLSSSQTGLVEDINQKTSDCRVFIPARQSLQIRMANWSTTAPDALSSYRAMADNTAESLFENARTTGDVQLLNQLLDQYFMTQVGDNAALLLAEIHFEKAQFARAAELWNSLIRERAFPGNSSLRYPDSEMPQHQLMLNVALSSLYGGDSQLAERQFEFLFKNYGRSTFQLFSRTGLSAAQLKKWYELERLKLVSVSPREQEFPIDPDRQPIWRTKLTAVSKSRSPFDKQKPAVGEHQNFTMATFPVIFREQVYWRDAHRIYASPVSGETPPRVIWETPFVNSQPDTTRKRIGLPRFQLTIADQKLFARMGDPTTSYRNDTLARNRSYLIGLDLNRGERALSGFPIEPPSERIEFESEPVYADGKLFYIQHQSFSDNSVAKLTVVCAQPTSSNRIDKPIEVWKSDELSFRTMNRGIWDEVSQSQLLLFDDQVVCVAPGWILFLDRNTGVTRKVIDYSRDRFIANRGAPTEAKVRPSPAYIRSGHSLFVLPVDSDFLFCFDLNSGRNIWRSRFANANQILGISANQLFVGGHQLLTIDRKTGNLLSAFPLGSGIHEIGFAINEPRGSGRGTSDLPWLYWPSRRKLFVFRVDLQGISPPRLNRLVDLEMRNLTGGNVMVNNGIMLIANERELVIFSDGQTTAGQSSGQ